MDATPTGTDTDTGTSTTVVCDGAGAVSKVFTGLETGSGSSASSATYRAVHNHKSFLPLEAFLSFRFTKFLLLCSILRLLSFLVKFDAVSSKSPHPDSSPLH